MAIDINEPVEQGADMVINHPDGTQTLGTAEEKDKTENVQGLHTNPAVEEKPEAPEEPVEKKAKK